MRRLPLALAVLASGLLAACSDDPTTVEAGDGRGDGTSTASTTVPRATTTPPAAPEGLVLQITTGGGFLPAELAFATFPVLTLYGDGRVVVPGATTLEYPGKALPALLAGTVGAEAVGAAVAAAREAGVGDTADLGRPPVADAPTTTFLLVEGGKTHRTEAYALDIDVDPGPGVSEAQSEARSRLRDLVARTTSELGAAATGPYRAEAVSVLTRPYAEVDRGGLPGEPAPGEAQWPLGDLAGGGREALGGRCLGFTGADAAKVLDAAADARSTTRWRSGGETWALTFRPELPGVEPCTDR